VRALLSVSDLDGLVAFARGLRELGWELVATDGTRAALKSEGIDALAVEDVTGSPTLLGGRVKTLHPRIHAAVLARRDDEQHQAELKREGIEPIDLIAVNLYPFTKSAAAGKRGIELQEHIDIGGVTLLRAGAKNYQAVVVVSRPERYQAVLDELKERKDVSLETRRLLAAEAFSHTAAYDAAIASRFVAEAGITFPDEMTLALRKVRDLRYGENPHQQAAFYALRGEEDAAMVAMEQVHGKAASFNNVLDINAAWRIAADFTQPTVAIVKHQNPCGIASELDVTSAYKRAFMCDSVSAFGGIVGANRTVTRELAEAMQDTFYEAIIAPGFEPDALPLLKQRKNLEILSVPNALSGKHLKRPDAHAFDLKRVAGGLLVQTPDETVAEEGNFKVVTERKPTLEELTDLIFAWRCVRHVTSNAIVIAKGLATVGVGPGQLSRVVAVEVAVRKAGENARLAVMASDAYFPFPDGIEVAARAGVTAIIQPGGSLRDAMMIETANRHRMAMLFTGRRHFKH
jgi:phosphoribosylaminoimidazolecarboxamide formyltransferase / IMP cyclohydrolase